MILIKVGHSFHYEIERLAMMFFPGERMLWVDTVPGDEDYILTGMREEQGGFIQEAVVRLNGHIEKLVSDRIGDVHMTGWQLEMKMGALLYQLLAPLTEISPSWGILTGVRPVKLFHQAIAEGKSRDEICRLFTGDYLVDPNCVDLAMNIQRIESAVISRSGRDSFSLFISIPFCPGRCRYCSFVSHSVEKAGHLLPAYLDKLCDEIRILGNTARELKLRLMTVYIGGGTPTILTTEQLERLFSVLEDSFDIRSALEYSLESGRPDSMTKEKLEVAKNAGVTRLCVNPQSLNDEVLARMGRRHTAENIFTAFRLARSLGFESINMDLIAGLPGEDLDSFKRSLDGVIGLGPENITVHALSLKRSSDLGQEERSILRENALTAARMIAYSRETLKAHGYLPYYMYRQKNTVGNLENTGYCKPGFEGLYNIYMMDETHTVLGAGAAAVTKLQLKEKTKIARIFNFKFPYEYIGRFSDILLRKDGIKSFYEECSRV